MNDEEGSDEKSKRIDISGMGKDMSDEKFLAAHKRLISQLNGLSSDLSGIGAAQKSMLGLRTLGSLTDIARQSEQLRQIADPFGLRAFTTAVDQATFGVSQSFLNSVKVDGAFAQLAVEIERQSKFFRSLSLDIDNPLGLMPSILRDLGTSIGLGVTRALDLPSMGATFAALDIGKYGQIFDSAIASRRLGLGPEFGEQFSIISVGLSQQMQTIGQIGTIASTAQIGLGLSGNIEEMLARTIAAQDALVEEYRAAAGNAEIEAVFHRRNATISTIINLLMFLLALALQIEERMTDRDEAVRANTEAVRSLQQSFESMATQMERMQIHAVSASEEDQAADAAITDLLREIANNLAEQSDMVREGTNAEPPSAD